MPANYHIGSLFTLLLLYSVDILRSCRLPNLQPASFRRKLHVLLFKPLPLPVSDAPNRNQGCPPTLKPTLTAIFIYELSAIFIRYHGLISGHLAYSTAGGAAVSHQLNTLYATRLSSNKWVQTRLVLSPFPLNLSVFVLLA